MLIRTYHIATVAALSLLAACTRVPVPGERGPVPSDAAIEFSLGEEQATKGVAPISTLKELALQDFSVSAWYTPQGETFEADGAHSLKYIENHRFGYVTNNLGGLTLNSQFTQSWRGVNKHGSTGSVTSNPVWWPLDGTLTFFCYAPYREEAIGSVATDTESLTAAKLHAPPEMTPALPLRDVIPGSSPEERFPHSDILLEAPLDPTADAAVISRLPGYLPGSPLIRVSPSASVSDQVDFLAAPPLLDRRRTDAGGKFPLDFRQHRLTQVEFLFNYDGQLDDVNESTDETKETVRVTSIEIKNVIASKYLYFTESTPYVWDCAWSDAVSPADKSSSDLPRASYRIDSEAGELITGYAASLPRANGANDNHRTVIPDNGKGRVYLLPQELSDDVELEISYAIYEKHGVTLKVSDLVTLKLRRPALTAWPMGKLVRYYITLQIPPHQNSTFTVQVYPWTNSGNSQGGAQELLPSQNSTP